MSQEGANFIVTYRVPRWSTGDTTTHLSRRGGARGPCLARSHWDKWARGSTSSDFQSIIRTRKSSPTFRGSFPCLCLREEQLRTFPHIMKEDTDWKVKSGTTHHRVISTGAHLLLGRPGRGGGRTRPPACPPACYWVPPGVRPARPSSRGVQRRVARNTHACFPPYSQKRECEWQAHLKRQKTMKRQCFLYWRLINSMVKTLPTCKPLHASLNERSP